MILQERQLGRGNHYHSLTAIFNLFSSIISCVCESKASFIPKPLQCRPSEDTHVHEDCFKIILKEISKDEGLQMTSPCTFQSLLPFSQPHAPRPTTLDIANMETTTSTTHESIPHETVFNASSLDGESIDTAAPPSKNRKKACTTTR